MKKIIILSIFVILSISQVLSQKFVWGDLKVSGNTYVNKNLVVTGNITSDSIQIGAIQDSLTVPYLKADSLKSTIINDSLQVAYLKTDSILLGTQIIKSAEGDSIPDLSWVRSYANTYYTGSLTDGTPTAAEIVGIAGTAASVGSGAKAVIKDTDGTGLVYLIVSDGTGWNYIALTLAL